MGLKGFGGYGGSQMGVNGGSPGTDLEDLGWYGRSVMGMGGMG